MVTYDIVPDDDDVDKYGIVVTDTVGDYCPNNGAASATKGAGTGELLTCISEEGLVDNYLLDDMYHENCITSCNKVEKYLMMSEFVNNVHVDHHPCCLGQPDAVPADGPIQNVTTSVL